MNKGKQEGGGAKQIKKSASFLFEVSCSQRRSHYGCGAPLPLHGEYVFTYARRMGQPTQRATNYTARSNIEPAQIFLHANGQSTPRSGSARDVGRGAGSHTPSTASESSGIDEKRSTETFVFLWRSHRNWVNPTETAQLLEGL